MVIAVTVSEPTGNAEQVFELQCAVIISSYANGIMAEGINEAELKAIADAKKQSENTGKKDGKKLMREQMKQTIQRMVEKLGRH